MTVHENESNNGNISFFKKEISVVKALGIFLAVLLATSSIMYAIGQRYYWQPVARTPQERGLNYYLALTEREPDSAEHWVNLGWYYYQAGDYAPALQAQIRALDIDPTHAGALFNSGITYIQMNDYASAMDYLERSTYYNPEYWEGYFALGVAYIGLEDWEPAENALLNAVDIYSASPEVWYYLGYVSEILEQFEDAVYYYEQVLRFIPDFAPALEALENIAT